jgi:aryl-alcohol dehydrogenase-like predicted oxidoreductase
MKKRNLGTSDLKVAPLCLGGNVFGWTVDEKTAFALLDAFTAAGFDFVDTADVYSAWVPGHAGGESETVLGNWLAARGSREKIVIATKVGMLGTRKGLKAANIIAACEDSLKRLQTGYIDLYQSHQDNSETPQDETLEAYSRLIGAGKIRAIGASNFDPSRLKAALEIARNQSLPRYATLQPLYNLVDRGFEKELQPLCVADDIGVIPYYSLAAGFLTGKYRTEADLKGRARGGTVARYLNPGNLALLTRLEKMAVARGAAMSEVAIAWLRDRPAVVAPIASATSLEQLQSLLRGASLTLTPEEVAVLG